MDTSLAHQFDNFARPFSLYHRNARLQLVQLVLRLPIKEKNACGLEASTLIPLWMQLTFCSLSIPGQIVDDNGLFIQPPQKHTTASA